MKVLPHCWHWNRRPEPQLDAWLRVEPPFVAADVVVGLVVGVAVVDEVVVVVVAGLEQSSRCLLCERAFELRCIGGAWNGKGWLCDGTGCGLPKMAELGDVGFEYVWMLVADAWLLLVPSEFAMAAAKCWRRFSLSKL